MEMNDTRLINVLTISNLSWEDRGQTFKCIALERNNGTRKETLGVWNISRSYHPPDPPLTCQADLQEGQIIRLSCNADKVYPDISCQPIRIFNDIETSLEMPMKYDKKSSIHHEYYCVNCSGIVFPYEAGDYRFCVNSTTAEQPNHPACTKILTIKNQTTVRIANDTITVNICPGEKYHMSIRCEILWWTTPEKPIVSCSVGDDVITNNSEIVATSHHTGQQYFSFESLCTFILTLKDIGKSVKCDVTATNLTQVLSAAAKIDFSYHPPKPPLFVYKGNENTKQTVFTIETNINVSVECTLDESNSESSVVTVECFGASMSEHFRQSQKYKAELFFIFSNDTNCTCTVEHASHCVINQTAKLFFVQEIRPVNSSWTCLGVHCLKYVIAAVAAGLCVICICVLYWVARRKHSGNALSYNCFRCFKLWQPVSLHDKDTVCLRNDTSNVTNLETSPYSVVDIVNPKINLHVGSNLSGHSFLSKHCQYSQVSQKCHLPPRRKPPPLPMSFCQHKTGKTACDSSCFDFQDNETDVRSFKDSTNITTIDSHCKMLPSEQTPPLPPRIKMKSNDQLPELPYYIRDDLLSCEETLRSFQLNNDSVDSDTASCRSSNNPHSLPKRSLPPTPCGLKSQCVDNFEDGLINRHDTNTNHNCCEDRINNGIGETTEAVSRARLQQLWPPPPIRARKPVGKERHISGKSKRRRQAVIRIITPKMNEHVKAPNSIRLDDSVNTYVNIKTQPPTAYENTNETFDSDDCCNGEDDASNCSRRLDDSDSWSSLSSIGSSSSCSSTSTIIEITRDCHGSQAEGALL